MINEVLDFISRKSVEAMIEDDTNDVEIQLTANTNNNAVDLKINQKHNYSMKVSNIGAKLNKQGLDYIMDAPISFTSQVEPALGSIEYEDLWNEGGKIKVSINPETGFAEKFLNAYSKQNAYVEIPVKEIPKVE